MKEARVEHLVTNALLRVERAVGEPPRPFEKPRDDLDFWVLELSYEPEDLPSWQKRVLPILRRHMNRMRQWRKCGMRFFLHVQTESPIEMLPALFAPTLLKTLSLIDCTLEHGVEIEPEQQEQSRTRRRTVRLRRP